MPGMASLFDMHFLCLKIQTTYYGEKLLPCPRLSSSFIFRESRKSVVALHDGYQFGNRKAKSRASTIALSLSNSPSAGNFNSEYDLIWRAVELSGMSNGLTAPHPNSGCVIATASGTIVGEGFLYGQGTASAELQAAETARDAALGGTAVLNLECGDCHGDDSAVNAIIKSGVSKVIVGMRHPLEHHRGKAVNSFREAGLQVEILGEGSRAGEEYQVLINACQLANAPLLYRSKYKMPFSVLKYGMTLDGKIAASTGHAAWVTSTQSRQRVFTTRGQSDAIIVGGNTVRRDDPRLTTRQESGHVPIRIVMSRTLRLPENANLWNVGLAPTIVMTQRGARKDFQKLLRGRGVEVVEFDFLTPLAVMEYCYQRGFLQVLWECGGTLSAPAIAAGVIHKILAFVAPKIIGGVTAPSPVGELGFVEMTQAINLSDTSFEQVGPDMLISGYLYPLPDACQPCTASENTPECVANRIHGLGLEGSPPVIEFYKAWDPYGAFSNFSSYSIIMPHHQDASKTVTWKSVEHYYQAQKFSSSEDETALEAMESIRNAKSPEEAARIGRRLERARPELVRPDWSIAKLDVMRRALECKFLSYSFLKSLLVSTVGYHLVEASPHDYFWGAGRIGNGTNHLGNLLMELRDKLVKENT